MEGLVGLSFLRNFDYEVRSTLGQLRVDRASSLAQAASRGDSLCSLDRGDADRGAIEQRRRIEARCGLDTCAPIGTSRTASPTRSWRCQGRQQGHPHPRPIENNFELVYGELGVYTTSLGTPCEDM